MAKITVTPDQWAAIATEIINLGHYIGVSPDMVAKMVDFESAGTWNPKIKNPNSSARGIFQWIDAAARDLGYTNSLELVEQNPTIIDQLKLARKWFLRAGSFRNDHDFAMANFLPAARGKPINTPLVDISVQAAKANPDIKITGDYTRKILSRKLPAGLKRALSQRGASGWLAMAGLVFAALFFSATVSCQLRIEKEDVTTIKPLFFNDKK